MPAYPVAHDKIDPCEKWRLGSNKTAVSPKESPQNLLELRPWIFASPFKIGRLPYAYTGTRQELEFASMAAGIGHVSSHAFRHTYRSWVHAVKTSIAVQQKMMQHTDIRTAMKIYGM
jgi:integrase